MMTSFFTAQPVTDYDSAMTADTQVYASFYRYMLEAGIYLAPSQFEVCFLSAAHSDEDLKRFLIATEQSYLKMLEDKKKSVDFAR